MLLLSNYVQGSAEMSAGHNAPPKTGWARMVAELHVTDLDVSLDFWAGILALKLPFSAKREDLSTWSIMLCQRHGRFETGPMQLLLGQGAMFQIYLRDIGSILDKLAGRNWPIYLGPREIWRRTGDRKSGQQEVFVQDPDGYLLMLAQSIDERFPTETSKHPGAQRSNSIKMAPEAKAALAAPRRRRAVHLRGLSGAMRIVCMILRNTRRSRS
jgi:catechol 2,3-dioxygenase-like lactoylglutathione lyase family enzyme